METTVSTLPVWVQTAGALAIAIVAAIIGVFKYIKTQVTTDNSLLIPKNIKEIEAAIRDHEEAFTRDMKKLIRSNEDLVVSKERSVEATQDNTRQLRLLIKHLEILGSGEKLDGF